MYLERWCIYGFDEQKIFEARYMAGNLLTCRMHRKYNKKNVELEGNTVKKS